MRDRNQEVDVARWFAERTAGLDADEREQAYQDAEAQIIDAVSRHLTDAPRRIPEDPETYAFLHRMADALRPEAREQLHRAIDVYREATRRGLPPLGRPCRLEYTDLILWIETAAKGLCPEAKERVRGEIDSHYEDARACELERGASETEAHAAAMAALGDPYRAKRALRKTYFTERDVSGLQAMSTYDPRSRYLLILSGFFPMLFLFGWCDALVATAIVGAWALGILGMFLEQDFLHCGRYRLGLTCRIVATIPAAGIICSLVLLGQDGFASVQSILLWAGLLTCLTVLAVRPRIRMLRKMRHNPEHWLDREKATADMSGERCEDERETR